MEGLSKRVIWDLKSERTTPIRYEKGFPSNSRMSFQFTERSNPLVSRSPAFCLGEPAPKTDGRVLPGMSIRSEEHTSELQSLMRISYAVFCLKKKKQT